MFSTMEIYLYTYYQFPLTVECFFVRYILFLNPISVGKYIISGDFIEKISSREISSKIKIKNCVSMAASIIVIIIIFFKSES